ETLVDKGFQEHEVHFSNDFAHAVSLEGASLEAEKIYKGQVLKLRKSTKFIIEVEKSKEEEFEVNNYCLIPLW
ncbi:hypothetical protein A2U01_0032526, partial [Trifolium medium]|nr:hypothetical protein [Trifolium medium]